MPTPDRNQQIEDLVKAEIDRVLDVDKLSNIIRSLPEPHTRMGAGALAEAIVERLRPTAD